MLLILIAINGFSGNWNNNVWLTDKTWFVKFTKNSLAIMSVSNCSLALFVLRKYIFYLYHEHFFFVYYKYKIMHLLIFLKIINFSFNWTQKINCCISRIRSNTDWLVDGELGPFPLIHRKSYASSRRWIFHKQCREPKLKIWFDLMLDLNVSKHILNLVYLNNHFYRIILYILCIASKVFIVNHCTICKSPIICQTFDCLEYLWNNVKTINAFLACM